MKFFAPLKVTLLAAAFSAQSAPSFAEITWAERYFNPAPLADDLILPMPCGGAMAFRPVETPSTEGTIGDVRVLLGQEGEDAPYLNGLRRSFLSGSFSTGGDNPKGLFYLGKYEVAQVQWDVVMGDACPEGKPRKRGFIPVVSRTPLEMAQFAEKYTIWLLNEAADSLPSAENTKGFLRLPTEDEWEFAARGGIPVGDVGFRAPRPPVPDGSELSEFIAHGGTESAGGKVQVIGTLNANPLGLHDMLGNVAEVVETPFSLVRHRRLHGQAGGIVKRGGDARTALASITSATRFEVPPYNLSSNTPFSDRYTGLRLTIAGLSITSSEQTEQMIEDLDRLAQGDTSLKSSEQDVDKILKSLEEQMETPQSLQQLAVVKDTIAASRAARNAQRNRSIRLVMESGTHLCDQTVGRLRNAEAINSVLETYDEIEAEAIANGDQATLDELAVARDEANQKLNEIQRNATRDLEDFGEIVEGLGDDYSLSLLVRQSSFIAPDVEKDGERRKKCLGALENALADRVSKGFTDLEEIENNLLTIARNEAE
ncbi:SUMF1/EgtB/PvdO family nonheme iron enzyme [uncultured Roseovarius sp.]|uniref:formylglycine-generating enzyme family protein n=1 Tax=uncultured Roseovarius sp. TaxID=293344 RepID=UPI00262AA05C|nr:SUMF1/EgtB/PvdO family nonheme iron enzyme [uncultured Roseovarius sp.]